MEVPRLGVESELQLPVYTTAMAMLDLSGFCYLQCSLWQCQVLNPLSEARNRTHIPMDTSWDLNPLSHSGNSQGRARSHGDKSPVGFLTKKEKKIWLLLRVGRTRADLSLDATSEAPSTHWPVAGESHSDQSPSRDRGRT